MSNDTTKKRRVGDDDHKVNNGDTATSMDIMVTEPKNGSSTLAAIMAEMKDMRNRLSHVNELRVE